MVEFLFYFVCKIDNYEHIIQYVLRIEIDGGGGGGGITRLLHKS